MHNNYTNSYPKVVSLVPSWTETLIEANVNVIGRTRFCIYPAQKVKDIAVVGGTKSVNIDQLSRLQPDFIVVDQQENTREMADQLTHANHKLIMPVFGGAGHGCRIAHRRFVWSAPQTLQATCGIQHLSSGTALSRAATALDHTTGRMFADVDGETRCGCRSRAVTDGCAD